MDKFIDIVIAPDGTMKIDTEGYQGQGCEAALKKLVKAMGGEIISSKRKDEYFEEGKVQIKSAE
jgi:hypothetical protein